MYEIDMQSSLGLKPLLPLLGAPQVEQQNADSDVVCVQHPQLPVCKIAGKGTREG